MSKETADFICPANKKEWRLWLEEHHEKEDAIWLIINKKGSENANLTWSEAVDEALCFGWIDSVKQSIDKNSYKQYFCKRKAKSTWSKINKDKVEVLIAKGLMSDAGFKSISIAKDNRSWASLDEIEQLIIPDDLKRLLMRKVSLIL